MGRVLPVLFNGEMVRAVLEGRKTVTRRKIDTDISNQFDVDHDGRTVVAYINQETGDSCRPEEICRYQPGDLLSVRETWAEWTGGYIYRAWPYPFPQPGCYPTTVWRPSIHMPKQAARIWLKVTNVKVERLKDIDTLGCRREGIDITGHGVFKRFSLLWDSTIRKADTGRYGWDANPWVWVIGFERCEKPEVEN